MMPCFQVSRRIVDLIAEKSERDPSQGMRFLPPMLCKLLIQSTSTMIARHNRTVASTAETFISNPRDKAQPQGAAPADARLPGYVSVIVKNTLGNLLGSATDAL